MKRIVLIVPIVAAFATFFVMNFFKLGPVENSEAATSGTATLTATVLQYLTYSATGTTVAFGNLTPGTPIPAPAAGTVVSITTNAANGYTIGVSDGVASTNSSMVHTDTTTYITDIAAAIAAPATWTGTGVGITLFAAETGKNTTTWGAGTTYNDALNKYAAVPETATVAHTAAGYKAGADTSSWAFKIDVPNTQKTGAYSGNVTFSATAVLS